MNPHPLFRLRNALWLAALTATVVLAGLGGWIALRADAWKAKGLEALNGQIDGTFAADHIDISWWHGFPDISINFRNASLIDAQGDTLGTVSRLGLELDAWTVFDEVPLISSLTLSQGEIWATQQRDGSWNVTQVLRNGASDNPEEGEVAMAISRIDLKDIAINMDSEREHWQGTGRITSSTWDDLDKTRWSVELAMDQITGTGGPWEGLRPLSWEVEAWVERNESEMRWAGQGDLAVQGVSTSWEGHFSSDQDWACTLRVPKVKLRDAETFFVDCPWKGHLELGSSATLNIQFGPNRIHADWTLKEGAFAVSPSWTGLTMALDGTCEGTGTWGLQGSDMQWAVTQGKAWGVGWAIQGSVLPKGREIQMEGWGSLSASVPFHSWIPNVPNAWVNVLPVAGQYRAEGVLTWDVEEGFSEWTGSFQGNQLMGTLDGQSYVLHLPRIETTASQPALLSCDSASFSWAGCDVPHFQWAFELTPWLQRGALLGHLDLHASTLHVDPILQWWDHLEDQDVEEARLLPPGSTIRIQASTDQLHWDALDCQTLSTRCLVTDRAITIQSLHFQGLEGRAALEGSVKPGLSGWQLTMRGALDDVSLPSLFATYDNFGQSTLRHDHLGGAVSTAGQLSMSWGLDGSWHPEHMTGSLQTSIAHGKLLHLEVFQEIADYLEDHRLMAPLVDPDDLRQRLEEVAFDPVSQRLDIRGQQVWLPQTTIRSTAMNVSMEGSYGFDNIVDYTLGFALRDLRASASDDVGMMVDDGLGQKFFLNMHGPIENPEYSYDREAAKANRREAFQAEKDRVLDAIMQRGQDSDTQGTSQETGKDVGPGTGQNQNTQSPGTPGPTTKEDAERQNSTRPSWRERQQQNQAEKDADLLKPDEDDYF